MTARTVRNFNKLQTKCRNCSHTEWDHFEVPVPGTGRACDSGGCRCRKFQARIQRPIMKGQTHATELRIDGDRVIGVCGEMEAQFVPCESGNIVWLPEDGGVGGRIDADQVPNLIAALQRLNDYLRS